MRIGRVGVVWVGLPWVRRAGAGGKLPGLRSTPDRNLESGAGEEEGYRDMPGGQDQEGRWWGT